MLVYHVNILPYAHSNINIQIIERVKEALAHGVCVCVLKLIHVSCWFIFFIPFSLLFSYRFCGKMPFSTLKTKKSIECVDGSAMSQRNTYPVRLCRNKAIVINATMAFRYIYIYTTNDLYWILLVQV